MVALLGYPIQARKMGGTPGQGRQARSLPSALSAPFRSFSGVGGWAGPCGVLWGEEEGVPWALGICPTRGTCQERLRVCPRVSPARIGAVTSTSRPDLVPLEPS